MFKTRILDGIVEEEKPRKVDGVARGLGSRNLFIKLEEDYMEGKMYKKVLKEALRKVIK